MPNLDRTDDRAARLRDVIRETMDGQPSLGRSGLLSKLVALLDAQRTVFATSEGRITDERSVPDNSAQLRALNMAFTLRDEFPHTGGVQVGLAVNMERLPDLSHLSVHELSRLAGISDNDDAALSDVAAPSDVVDEQP